MTNTPGDEVLNLKVNLEPEMRKALAAFANSDAPAAKEIPNLLRLEDEKVNFESKHGGMMMPTVVANSIEQQAGKHTLEGILIEIVERHPEMKGELAAVMQSQPAEIGKMLNQLEKGRREIKESGAIQLGDSYLLALTENSQKERDLGVADRNTALESISKRIKSGIDTALTIDKPLGTPSETGKTHER